MARTVRKADVEHDLAKRILDDVHAATGKLTDSLDEVKARGSAEDFKRYRLTVAKVIGVLFSEIEEPIYQEHPELEPSELRDTVKL